MRGPRALLLLGLLAPAPAAAQSLFDGDVLPRNVGGLIISPLVGYGPGVLQRFGNGWQGGRESILEDFDGIQLEEVLGNPEQVRLAAGGQLGTTNFFASQQSFGINFTAAYGITDRLTVAAILPFQWVRYDLDAFLTYDSDVADGQISNLRVADDPSAIRCPGGNFDLDDPNDLVRLGDFQEGYRFNVGDLNRAATTQCLGYDPIFDRTELGEDGLIHGRQTRTVSGLRDLVVGAKYQVFRGEWVRLAVLGFGVLGTGRPPDPDKLIDFKLGDGNSSVGAMLGATFPLGKFRVGLSIGYEIELPDTERLRLANVSFSPALEDQLARGQISEAELFEGVDNAEIEPLVTRFDVVEAQRKLGDNIYGYGIVGYQVLEWLSVGATFQFLHHFRDRLDALGPRPEGTPDYPTEGEVRSEVQRLIDAGEIDEDQRIEELKIRLRETEGRKRAAYGWRTVRGQLGVGVGLNFNTLAMFARDEFPVPIIASISISRFVAGQNIDTPDAVQLNLTLPFAFGEVKDPAEWGYDEDGEGPPWP